jgi:hypothetical protein
MAADLVLAADPGVVGQALDPETFVVAACERAKAWLREVLEHGEIEQIAEITSQAEAVRVYTAQKRLGKDAQLRPRRSSAALSRASGWRSATASRTGRFGAAATVLAGQTEMVMTTPFSPPRPARLTTRVPVSSAVTAPGSTT